MADGEGLRKGRGLFLRCVVGQARGRWLIARWLESRLINRIGYCIIGSERLWPIVGEAKKPSRYIIKLFPSIPTLSELCKCTVAVQSWREAQWLTGRFNLGISYINLGQYAQAAQSVLDALRLQHADATEGYAAAQLKTISSKGITSGTLWNTLRNACMQ